MTASFPIQLALRIRDTTYDVRPLRFENCIASRAFRLYKDDGTAYQVIQTRFGAERDCPEFVFRRAGIDPVCCKHVRALAARGMLEHSTTA
jgi:hypothetical protein